MTLYIEAAGPQATAGAQETEGLPDDDFPED
jgi:hypothetical protein